MLNYFFALQNVWWFGVVLGYHILHNLLLYVYIGCKDCVCACVCAHESVIKSFGALKDITEMKRKKDTTHTQLPYYRFP